MTDISLAAITRIIKSIDPDIRVGKETKEELRTNIEEYAARISELAISMARNANRTTVLSQDIETAKEQLMKGIAFVQNTQ
jgi:histone H3/H4